MAQARRIARAFALRLGAAVLAAAACVGWPPRAGAQASDALAKARFAITFARFVQWPSGDGQPLRLCVLQNSPSLAQAFSAREGESVGGRRLAIQLRPAGAAECDLLFVDDSGSSAAAPMLADARTRPVLTLGAIDGFLMQGGMVELVNVDDALRFDVDLRSARGARLGLNSQVLKLARRVKE